MRIYRLGSSRYPANDGLGASLYGGRWNHKGTPVIYAVASRALCALEILANADELARDYAVTPIEWADDVSFTTLSTGDLPSGWNAAQPMTETAEIGTGMGSGAWECCSRGPFGYHRARAELRLKPQALRFLQTPVSAFGGILFR